MRGGRRGRRSSREEHAPVQAPQDETANAWYLRQFVDQMVTYPIIPADINPALFLRMETPELLAFDRAWNVIAAQANGVLYQRDITNNALARPISNSAGIVQPRAVFYARVVEHAKDAAVGVEDFTRINTSFGVLSAKSRYGIILEVHGSKAIVLTCTSFSARGAPPDKLRARCFRLSHVDNNTPVSGVEDIPLIRYTGDDILTMTSFLNHKEIKLIDLEMPFTIVGNLEDASFATVEHTMRWRLGQQFSEEAAKRRTEAAAEAVAEARHAQRETNLLAGNGTELPELDL